MTLSNQIRELAGKATPGPFSTTDKHSAQGWDTWIMGEGGEADLCEIGACWSASNRMEAESNATLIVAIYNNLPTILAALELAERLEAPGCVEEVKAAMESAEIRNKGDTFTYQLLHESLDFYLYSQHDEYVTGLSQAAISAMKGEK